MISIGLNLILGLMLFCALVMGMRLERRLKALRSSHLDFAKAVSELDQAALRTESSLAALRAGTETARTDLAARIDQARLVSQRLEQLTVAAEKAANQPLPLAAFEPPAQRPAAEPVMLRPVPVPVPAARSRVLVDDDLFDNGPARQPRLAAMGGRR